MDYNTLMAWCTIALIILAIFSIVMIEIDDLYAIYGAITFFLILIISIAAHFKMLSSELNISPMGESYDIMSITDTDGNVLYQRTGNIATYINIDTYDIAVRDTDGNIIIIKEADLPITFIPENASLSLVEIEIYKNIDGLYSYDYTHVIY